MIFIFIVLFQIIIGRGQRNQNSVDFLFLKILKDKGFSFLPIQFVWIKRREWYQLYIRKTYLGKERTLMSDSIHCIGCIYEEVVELCSAWFYVLKPIGRHACMARPPSPEPRHLFLPGAQFSIVIVLLFLRSVKSLFEITSSLWFGTS